VEAVNGNIKGIQEPALPPAEGTAHGGGQDGIRGLQESGLKCGSRRILADSPKTIEFGLFRIPYSLYLLHVPALAVVDQWLEHAVHLAPPGSGRHSA
jgi:hypothetical protein